MGTGLVHWSVSLHHVMSVFINGAETSQLMPWLYEGMGGGGGCLKVWEGEEGV